jgi:hypothetical protein
MSLALSTHLLGLAGSRHAQCWWIIYAEAELASLVQSTSVYLHKELTRASDSKPKSLTPELNRLGLPV